MVDLKSIGIDLSKASWDSIIAGVLCIIYALIPEPTDVLPVIGWLDEGVAAAAGLKLIIDGINGVSITESIKKMVGGR
ncbi:MAG: hypothetical protein QXQ95_08725 [Thermofilum sp.]|uniref:hypothetical protein n=1 Tax=Thermofilum sp. TaxID=1961369 RepID=UPI003174D259